MSQNLNVLSVLKPELENDIRQKVDLALDIELDTKVNKEFLKCEYNLDGSSHRSPHTNEYFPPLENA